MPVARSSYVQRDLVGGITAFAGEAITTKIVRIQAGISNAAIAVTARSNTLGNQYGPLYYLDTVLLGTATAAFGDTLRLSPLCVVTTAAAVTDPIVVGQPLYLTDLGGVDNVAGTIPRKIGVVLSTVDPGARTVTWLFDGALASKHLVEETTGVKLLSGLNLANGQLQLKVREETIADGNVAPYPEVRQDDCVVAILRSAVAGAARHIDMPTTPLLGQVVTLKDADASAAASNIVIHGNGYQLDGDPDVTWNTNGTWMILVFSGTRWLRMS